MIAFFLNTLILAAMTCGLSWAGIEQAPPAFGYKDSNAIFVDFQTAHYEITFDIGLSKTTVKSRIVFVNESMGYPVFDLVDVPKDISVDGLTVNSELIFDPDKSSSFRTVEKVLAPGRHTLSMTHELSSGVRYEGGKVRSGFWMTDLSNRYYLERYLPASFSYDQVVISIEVQILGAGDTSYILRSNGDILDVSPSHFRTTYPGYYTTSSLFFHLAPADAFQSEKFVYESIDKRQLQVEVYANESVTALLEKVPPLLAKLENEYGPFPHSKLIVYGGGYCMEYAGALVAEDPGCLDHELFHSYNARAMMPADGNAGWIDEAMASWRDRGYPIESRLGQPTKMAGHSPYNRVTDRDGYTYGRIFLSWIASRLQRKKLDLKEFFRVFITDNLYKTVTTDLFRRSLEEYSKIDFSQDFDRYVYGKESISDSENEGHPSRR